jgi:hypothetical protein
MYRLLFHCIVNAKALARLVVQMQAEEKSNDYSTIFLKSPHKISNVMANASNCRDKFRIDKASSCKLDYERKCQDE